MDFISIQFCGIFTKYSLIRPILHVRMQKCHFKSISNDSLVNLTSMYGQPALDSTLAFTYFFKSLIHTHLKHITDCN